MRIPLPSPQSPCKLLAEKCRPTMLTGQQYRVSSRKYQFGWSKTCDMWCSFPPQKLNWKLWKCCSMTRPTSLEFYFEGTAPTSLSRAPEVQMGNYSEILQNGSDSSGLICSPQSSSHVQVEDLVTLDSRNRTSIPFVTKIVVKVWGEGGLPPLPWDMMACEICRALVQCSSVPVSLRFLT
uniref:Uncharacterized protein n=1 Tax=Timema monikensis TaxID=170555 RepID=A0A7R9E848_9NEOP|nr:unnamed protein product [Timema monikensis]